jgi:hypothetical protein
MASVLELEDRLRRERREYGLSTDILGRVIEVVPFIKVKLAGLGGMPQYPSILPGQLRIHL